MAELRLIDANALKSLLIEVLERIKENPKMKIDEMHIIAGCHMLCEMIDDAITIDAVPVVRCKDCMLRGEYLFCPMVFQEWYYNGDETGYDLVDNSHDDGFCHKGAKMDGGVVDG